jgi:hypothetical protein
MQGTSRTSLPKERRDLRKGQKLANYYGSSDALMASIPNLARFVSSTDDKPLTAMAAPRFAAASK